MHCDVTADNILVDEAAGCVRGILCDKWVRTVHENMTVLDLASLQYVSMDVDYEVTYFFTAAEWRETDDLALTELDQGAGYLGPDAGGFATPAEEPRTSTGVTWGRSVTGSAVHRQTSKAT